MQAWVAIWRNASLNHFLVIAWSLWGANKTHTNIGLIFSRTWRLKSRDACLWLFYSLLVRWWSTIGGIFSSPSALDHINHRWATILVDGRREVYRDICRLCLLSVCSKYGVTPTTILSILYPDIAWNRVRMIIQNHHRIFAAFKVGCRWRNHRRIEDVERGNADMLLFVFCLFRLLWCRLFLCCRCLLRYRCLLWWCIVYGSSIWVDYALPGRLIGVVASGR